MIIHFNIYNAKTGNFEANPNLAAQTSNYKVTIVILGISGIMKYVIFI